MARFELTLTGNDKIIVDHASETMPELLEELCRTGFALFREVKAGQVTRDIIISTSQITLARSLLEGSTQGSSFRPKR